MDLMLPYNIEKIIKNMNYQTDKNSTSILKKYPTILNINKNNKIELSFKNQSYIK